MAGVGSSNARVRGPRTRRPMHAVLLAVILTTAAGLVWFSVLHQTQDGCPTGSGADNPHRSVQNPRAAAAAASSERLPADGLDTVPPAPPQFTRVHVLNAGGVLGEAAIVDGALASLGFAATTTPANDPQHPAFDLRCYGEIRFGVEGQAAARTLSLAVPCAGLVRDARPDAGVDLALGTRFVALRPNDAARTALLDLAGLGQPVPAQLSPRSGLAVQVGSRVSGPGVNGDILRRARQVTC
ncbi:MAG: envelope integrity protein Cei [Pseudonocardiaceae bacterium]